MASEHRERKGRRADGGRQLPVLWLYGPPGVGKSTVAWELFTELAGGGMPTGYVDLNQRTGFCNRPPTSRD